ncbi:olfactory receptor 11A1-like [Ascaphus truei]|uniref:olfactory receptor 11A1-like n=1 Tax=Ascaphus truei TaxID=8439 RepID=UPI003F59C94B
MPIRLRSNFYPHQSTSQDNQTTVREFLLLGFPDLHSLKILVFSLLLIVYIVTVTGNVLIIGLVTTSQQFHTPMYFFLGHLSVSDIFLITNIVPKMLQVILEEGATIPLASCITQIFINGSSISTECFLLTVMSYDRYLAICNPLHYTSIMDVSLCYILITLCWLLGFMPSLIGTWLVCELQLCGPNIIDHFYCEFGPLLELSCSDTSIVEIVVFVLAIPILLFPFVFVLLTYVYISLTILRIPSTTGKQKAFFTCSSHLAVCVYYGTLISKYMVPSRGHLQTLNKVLSLLCTVVTSLFNPIIYSLRNQEIRAALKKCIWMVIGRKQF